MCSLLLHEYCDIHGNHSHTENENQALLIMTNSVDTAMSGFHVYDQFCDYVP